MTSWWTPGTKGLKETLFKVFSGNFEKLLGTPVL